MNSKRNIGLLALTCGLMLAQNAMAAAPKIEFPQASPGCTVKQKVGLTDIEVDYSRPGVKDRDIFGALVPYGQVWRTGANSATKIIFNTPVKLNGTEVAAGTYALFTVPGKDEWTIIINKGSEQWGAYKYDEKDDVVRIKATPVTISDKIDSFTIEFDKLRDDSASLDLMWDHTIVPIAVKVDIVDKITKQIEDVMNSDAKDKPYFRAAAFYYDHNLDLNKASKWIDAAIAEKESHPMFFVKAEILAKLGDKTGALAAAKHANELAVKANDPGYVKQSSDLMSKLQ